ncbi:uncharacterized protein LOC132735428 [Ruditapes philippinarum]|uniref:uncharacterized protein LOC132735428 n=1 Tax=Ruditapes philippinarum TaxID=129788 RepID=UPI00295B9C88|nr:uncharacterized protein LOC132735428 [Ruditapes philippinarum]
MKNNRHFNNNIANAGDIALNPGPFKCGICLRTVAKNHRALCCDQCDKWIHIKCAGIAPARYTELGNSEESWFCQPCDSINNIHNIFNFSNSLFEDLQSPTSVNSVSINRNISATDCDNHVNINDSFCPEPDPEEDWLINNSNISTHTELSTDQEDCDSRYDIFDELRNMRQENRKRPIISYLNINSIRYKFDDLQQILHDKLCDMLIISETKLDISFNNNLFTVDGYKMERRDRNSHGGGIMTFVRADLPFKRRKDLESDSLEGMIIF